MATVEIELTFVGDRTTPSELSLEAWLTSVIADEYPEAASAIVGSITEASSLAPLNTLFASSVRRHAPPDRDILRFFSQGEYEYGLGFGVPSFEYGFLEDLASYLTENGATWRWDVRVSVFSLQNQFLEGTVILSPEDGLEWSLNEVAGESIRKSDSPFQRLRNFFSSARVAVKAKSAGGEQGAPDEEAPAPVTMLRVTADGKHEVVSRPFIIDLVTQGNDHKLKAFLDHFPLTEVDSREEATGYTALHYAAWDSRPDLVTILLEFGANPNVRGTDGRTPLHLGAGSVGNSAVVSALIQAGADLEARTAEENPYHPAGGATPLFDAVLNSRWEAATRLEEDGASLAPLLEANSTGGSVFSAARELAASDPRFSARFDDKALDGFERRARATFAHAVEEAVERRSGLSVYPKGEVSRPRAVNEEKVKAWVAHKLAQEPQISTVELYETAKKVDAGVKQLSLSQFAALFSPQGKKASELAWFELLLKNGGSRVEKGAVEREGSKEFLHREAWEALAAWVEEMTDSVKNVLPRKVPWHAKPHSWQNSGYLSSYYWGRIYPPSGEILKDAFHVGIQIADRPRWIDSFDPDLEHLASRPCLALWVATNDNQLDKIAAAYPTAIEAARRAFLEAQTTALASILELPGEDPAVRLFRKTASRGGSTKWVSHLLPAEEFVSIHGLQNAFRQQDDLESPTPPGLWSPLVSLDWVKSEWRNDVDDFVSSWISLLAPPVQAAVDAFQGELATDQALVEAVDPTMSYPDGFPEMFPEDHIWLVSELEKKDPGAAVVLTAVFHKKNLVEVHEIHGDFEGFPYYLEERILWRKAEISTEEGAYTVAQLLDLLTRKRIWEISNEDITLMETVLNTDGGGEYRNFRWTERAPEFAEDGMPEMRDLAEEGEIWEFEFEFTGIDELTVTLDNGELDVTLRRDP